MNNSEKLELIERIERASKAQARKALKSMVLECSTKSSTIARAIKDAVERHTPTPVIVYKEPESADEVEASFPAPDKKKKRKKKKTKDTDDGINGEGDVPSKPAKKRQKNGRGDINADPLVSQLILRRAKSKRKSDRKVNHDRHERHKTPKSSDRKTKKRLSKFDTEANQHITGVNAGEPSEPNSPIIIDLVTSSDSDTSDGDNFEKKTAGGELVVQGEIGGCVSPREDEKLTSKMTSGKKAKLSTDITHHDLKSSKILNKKRKSVELEELEANDSQGYPSAVKVLKNKRPKWDHLRESQDDSKNPKCQKCLVKFQSLRRLAEHFQKCLIAPYVPATGPSRAASSLKTPIGPQSLQEADHASKADVEGMKPSPLQQVIKAQEPPRKPAAFPIPVFEAGHGTVVPRLGSVMMSSENSRWYRPAGGSGGAAGIWFSTVLQTMGVFLRGIGGMEWTSEDTTAMEETEPTSRFHRKYGTGRTLSRGGLIETWSW
ncbi:hypothetical protein diail_823 [Diaporthe ilicicola]|nr:hypothetical protein diail_823 [Diaporthe ilicicola]